jgi:hypothetical protein
MPAGPLRLVKRFAEFSPKDSFVNVPRGTRGMYALLNKSRKSGKDRYDVVYIGMARGRGGVRSRLRSHKNSVRKGKLWTHFSVFEVWNNITDDEIAELEGLFRHIYRKDTQANRVNRQRQFKKLRSIRNNKLLSWRPLS